MITNQDPRRYFLQREDAYDGACDGACDHRLNPLPHRPEGACGACGDDASCRPLRQHEHNNRKST